MLTEGRVIDAVRQELLARGTPSSVRRRSPKHGDDIVAEKDGGEDRLLLYDRG